MYVLYIIGCMPCYCIIYFGEFTFRIITLRFWFMQVNFCHWNFSLT